VQLQLFDTNTDTYLIYRKEEAWNRHDTLEMKLQTQRHTTCVPFCISKARIILKSYVGKHLDTAPSIIETELYCILFCRQYSSARNSKYALAYNESRFWHLFPLVRAATAESNFAETGQIFIKSFCCRSAFTCRFREQNTKSVEFNPQHDFQDYISS
jgi:hypothetical protein